MSRSRNRRIILSSSAGLAQKLIQLLATLVTFPLLLHSLGTAGFGVWAAATSLAWLSGVLDLGLGSALVNLVPQAMAAGEPERGRDYVAATLSTSLVLALMLLAAGLAVVLVWPGAVSPAFEIAGLVTIISVPLNTGNALWFGLQKAYVAAGWQIAQNVLAGLLVVACALSGAGVVLTVSATYSATLLVNIAVLVHVLKAYPQLRPRRLPAFAVVRTVLRQGGQMFAISVAAMSVYTFDNILTLHWLGGEAAARMAVVMRVCTTATGLMNMAALPVWPGFVEAAAGRDLPWLGRTLQRGTLMTAILGVAGSAVLIVVGAPVLRWWLHHDFDLNGQLRWLMAAWIVMMALPQVAGLLLTAVGELRPQILVYTVTALAGLALKYEAARRFGVPGMLAVAPLLSALVTAPVLLGLAFGWLRRQGRAG